MKAELPYLNCCSDMREVKARLKLSLIDSNINFYKMRMNNIVSELRITCAHRDATIRAKYDGYLQEYLKVNRIIRRSYAAYDKIASKYGIKVCNH